MKNIENKKMSQMLLVTMCEGWKKIETILARF